MKEQFYPDFSEFDPPNVLFFEYSKLEDRDEIIDAYIDLLKNCKNAEEFYALFHSFYEEVVNRTAKLIIEKQIHKNIEILEELRRDW